MLICDILRWDGCFSSFIIGVDQLLLGSSQLSFFHRNNNIVTLVSCPFFNSWWWCQESTWEENKWNAVNDLLTLYGFHVHVCCFVWFVLQRESSSCLVGQLGFGELSGSTWVLHLSYWVVWWKTGQTVSCLEWRPPLSTARSPMFEGEHKPSTSFRSLQRIDQDKHVSHLQTP